MDKIKLHSLSKGLFLWARLTVLARFPRSRLTFKSFVKFSMCSYERVAWLTEIPVGKTEISVSGLENFAT